MMKFKIVLLLMINSSAWAGCFFSLSTPSINYTVNAEDLSAVNYSFNISRGNSEDTKCNTFLIGISKGGASSYNRLARNSSTGETIPYNLYKTNSSTTMIRRIEDASSLSQLLDGSINRNSSKMVDYFFKLGSLSNSSLLRGGTYRDLVAVTVDSGDKEDLNNEVTNTLEININVPKMASLSMVSSGSPYDPSKANMTLDFGELTENEEMSFDVIVLSNAGYNLSVASANKQSMALQSSSPSPQTQIGYQFYANNSLKNLSSSTPVSIMTGAGVTPVQGTRIPIKVVIQSVIGKDPGLYQDYITFTIATTE